MAINNTYYKEPEYIPTPGSCDYDEHENDMYYLGDNLGNEGE